MVLSEEKSEEYNNYVLKVSIKSGQCDILPTEMYILT